MKRKIVPVTLSLTLIFASLLVSNNICKSSASSLDEDNSVFSFEEDSLYNMSSFEEDSSSDMSSFEEESSEENYSEIDQSDMSEENTWNNVSPFYGSELSASSVSRNDNSSADSLFDKSNWNSISGHYYMDENIPIFSYVDFSPFVNSDGSCENPYRISTAAQLAAVSVLSNNSSNQKLRDRNYIELHGSDFTNCYLIIDNDIDIHEYYWTPIGKENFFNGTIDFYGHTVNGLKLKAQSGNSYEYLGLFGRSRGFICNLNMGSLCDINYSTNDVCFGGIVAHNIGTVYSCTSELKALINGGAQAVAGGIVGFNSGKGRILKCCHKGTVSAASLEYEIVGGIVGFLEKGSVEQCVNEGTVMCDNFYSPEENGEIYTDRKRSYIGGIVGEKAAKDTIINECMNVGNLDYFTSIIKLRCGEIVGCGNNWGVKNCCYQIRPENEMLFVNSETEFFRMITVAGMGSIPGVDLEGSTMGISSTEAPSYAKAHGISLTKSE